MPLQYGRHIRRRNVCVNKTIKISYLRSITYLLRCLDGIKAKLTCQASLTLCLIDQTHLENCGRTVKDSTFNGN
ncbi:hypothetical protein ScPMuIL_014592 [Solemya velum]